MAKIVETNAQLTWLDRCAMAALPAAILMLKDDEVYMSDRDIACAAYGLAREMLHHRREAHRIALGYHVRPEERGP